MNPLVVVNPSAGGGRAGILLEQLRAHSERFRSAPVLVPASSCAVRTELRAQIERYAPDRLLILGGDGTIHDIVNCVLDAERGDLPLGLIPGGTGSDLARNLGLPADPREALARALEGDPAPVDVLRVDRNGPPSDASLSRWVVNIASIGISGAVDEAVNARPDRNASAYLRATIPALLRYRPRPCRIEVDGEIVHDGPLLLAAIANGRCFGRGMPVAPRAEPNDGIADVVVVPPIPLWRLPPLLPLFLRGRHLDHPLVTWRRGRTIRLDPAEGGPPLDLDGETWPSGPVSVTLHPGALRIIR